LLREHVQWERDKSQRLGDEKLTSPPQISTSSGSNRGLYPLPRQRQVEEPLAGCVADPAENYILPNAIIHHSIPTSRAEAATLMSQAVFLRAFLVLAVYRHLSYMALGAQVEACPEALALPDFAGPGS